MLPEFSEQSLAVIAAEPEEPETEEAAQEGGDAEAPVKQEETVEAAADEEQ